MQPTAPTIQLPMGNSTIAGQVDSMYYLIYWISVVFFVGIVGAMVVFLVKYRRRGNEKGAPTGHNTALEVFWTFSPLIILVFLFHQGFKGYLFGLRAPENAIEIRVRASQWKWEFEYPGGMRQNSELRVPVGTPIKLIMSSDDVIHSFYVPEFRIKRDVVPGMYSTVWFEAINEGEYTIFCTEFCGTSHAAMLGTARVVSREAYDRFLAEGVGPREGETPEQWGERLFSENACNSCHSRDGAPAPGPTFKGLFGRTEQLEGGASVTVDENYLRESILQPQAKIVRGFSTVVMPTYAATLRDRQLDALIAYIKTIR